MKSVLISIQPKWCELIASGKKTVEVRKTRPKIETPFKVYIYCTSIKSMPLDEYVKIHRATGGCIDDWHGKVIGEFVCDDFEMLFDTNGNPENYMSEILPDILKRTALTYNEFQLYANGRASKNSIYGWHISDLVIYEQPKELREFKKFCTDFYDGKHCGGCEYFIDGRGYEYDESDCGCDGLKPITRPPQSWCYVEEGNGHG